MTTQNDFVNAYIETATATLQEYMSNILHLKTQIKISNDIIAGKDSVIATLSEDLTKHQSKQEANSVTLQENNLLKEHITNLDSIITAQNNKLAHLDTALKQIVEMKKQLAEKDELIQMLDAPKKSKKSKKIIVNRENDF